MLRGIIAAVFVLIAAPALAQSNCVLGGTYTDGQGNIMYCTGVGTATKLAKGADAVPSGLIALSLTTCPAGWAEVPTLNGVMLRGTVAANGNVGTPGGADSRTPVGVVAFPFNVPLFTGAALAGHAHELPFQIPSTTTTRQIAAATFGTGLNRTATAVSATGTGNTTNAAVALSQAVSAGTPSGTIAWPINPPQFVGSALDVRPAYVNVIFCSKS